MESNSRITRTVFEAQQLQDDTKSKMADDLHSSHLLNSSLKDAFKFINTSQTRLKLLIAAQKEAKEVPNVPGLLSDLPYLELWQQFKDKALTRAGMMEENEAALI
ncbi:hypothetical protein Ancab_018517 [Ancistrocladus abbreviatus]